MDDSHSDQSEKEATGSPAKEVTSGKSDDSSGDASSQTEPKLIRVCSGAEANEADIQRPSDMENPLQDSSRTPSLASSVNSDGVPNPAFLQEFPEFEGAKSRESSVSSRFLELVEDSNDDDEERAKREMWTQLFQDVAAQQAKQRRTNTDSNERGAERQL